MQKRCYALLLALSMALWSGCGRAGVGNVPEEKTEKEESPVVVVLPGQEEMAEDGESAEKGEGQTEDSPEEPQGEERTRTIYPTEEEPGPWEWDLDGDGKKETVELLRGDGDEESCCISVVSGTDTATRRVWKSHVDYDAQLCPEDLDGDGAVELLFWGDQGSDDYVLQVLRWDGEFTVVPFAGNEDLQDYLCGWAAEVEGREITVHAPQYVLGTYEAQRRYVLSDDDVFEPENGSIWEFVGNELWLTATKELPAALSNGTSAVQPGEKIRLLGWDGVSKAYFEREDGTQGVLSLGRSEDYGWHIGGEREYDCFTSLPYAG